jgi:hypothetical protein
MLGLFLIAYIAAPLLMLAASAGAGLLVWRVSGRHLAPVLVLPAGFAALLAIGTFLTAFDFTAELNAGALVLFAVGGLVLERRTVADAARSGWAFLAPGLAALAGYLLMVFPAMSTGTASWTGYQRITDLNQQFNWAAWLVTRGREIPPVRDGGFLEVISKTAVTGYPGAGNAVFGSTAQIFGVEPAWTYQALMGLTVAMLVLAVYGLLERVVESRGLRTLGAFVAAQPSILFGYGMVGGIKEYTSAFGLIFCGALLNRLRPSEQGLRGMLPLALGVSGTIGSFSLTIGPWMAVLLPVAAAMTVLVRRWEIDKRALAIWAGTAVVIAALSAPMLYWATQLAKVAVQAEGSDATALIDLGNLRGPIPVRSALGAWISGDYRNPSLGDTPQTAIVLAVIAALALVGLWAAWRARHRGLLVLALSTAIATLYYVTRTGPWIELKAICLTGPIVLSLAFAGVAWLGRAAPLRTGRGALAAGGAAIVAAGVLAGNALAIHDITLAPGDRMRDLDRVGQQFAGQGPAVYPAHEEYAELFLRDLKVTALVNPGPGGIGPPQLRPDVLANGPEFSRAYDLDAFIVTWLEQAKLIVQRRGPFFSRPPARYELVRRSQFTDVWRRASDEWAFWHVAVPGAGPKEMRQDCRELIRRVPTVNQDTSRIAYAIPPKNSVTDLDETRLPAPWRSTAPDTVVMNGPGSVDGTVQVPESGEYRIWVQGAEQRPVTVTIDGRQVGVLKGAWSYTQGWTLLSTRRMEAGSHAVRMSKGSGRPWPGDGAAGAAIGPVVLERADDPEAGTVRYAPLSQARQVCRDVASYDWAELVTTSPPA